MGLRLRAGSSMVEHCPFKAGVLGSSPSRLKSSGQRSAVGFQRQRSPVLFEMVRRASLVILPMLVMAAVDLEGQAVSPPEARVAREWAQKAAQTAFPTNGYNLRGDSVHLCPSAPPSPLVHPAGYDFSAELYDPKGKLFFDKRFSFPVNARPCTGLLPEPQYPPLSPRLPTHAPVWSW